MAVLRSSSSLLQALLIVGALLLPPSVATAQVDFGPRISLSPARPEPGQTFQIFLIHPLGDWDCSVPHPTQVIRNGLVVRVIVSLSEPPGGFTVNGTCVAGTADVVLERGQYVVQWDRQFLFSPGQPIQTVTSRLVVVGPAALPIPIPIPVAADRLSLALLALGMLLAADFYAKRSRSI